jgi:hypothetical protein
MEFVMPLHVHTNRRSRKDMWWYPYTSDFYNNFAELATKLTGGFSEKRKAISTFLRAWRSKRI